MKRPCRRNVLLLGIAFVLFLLPSIAMAKMRVAVLDFQDNSGAGAPGGAIADMMTTELFNAGVFTVVERNQLGAVATEQRLAAQGLVDPSTAVQMGKVLGVEGLITGSITQYYYKGSGGVVPPAPPSACGALYSGSGCGSLYWLAVFMPLLPTLG